MTRLAELLTRHRSLIVFTFLTYFDRLISVATPLAVLYVAGERRLYNEMEYIYSIGVLVSIVLDLGVTKYLFYAYKEADERQRLLELIRTYFFVQFGLFVGLGTLATAICLVADLAVGSIYHFILIRSLYWLLLSFMAVYFRLVDRPSMAYIPSLCANTVTLGLVLAAPRWLGGLNLTHVFASQLGVCGLAVFYLWRYRHGASLTAFLGFTKAALKFAWPVIANVFLFMFISNYGKIYSRNFLSEAEMFQISFVQRLALVIQLAHASATGYVSKKLYTHVDKGVNLRILALYSLWLFFGVVGTLLLMTAAAWYGGTYAVGFDWVTFCILLYTVTWCYLAYFELYLGKLNKNKFLLLFSGISVLVFIVTLKVLSSSALLGISLAMVVSMACNLSLVLSYLRWKAR